MAYIRLPDNSYTTVPDGLSYEEALTIAQRKYPKLFGIEPTVGGQIREFVKGVPAGFVGSFGQAARGIGSLLPEEYEKPFAKNVESTVKALTPEAAPGYEDTVGRKLGEVMGSVGSFLVPGGAAGAGAKALGYAPRLAQLGTAGALGSAAGAGEARTRAEAEGATPEQRRTATQFGAAIGLSEIAPVERLLGSLGKEAVGGIVNTIKRVAISGGVEAAQETASNLAQNLVAQKLYKPGQELAEGLGEAAAYGGAAGALTDVLLNMALGRRAGPRPGAQQPGAAPAEEQKARPEDLFQERIPLLDRSRELRAALKAKDLDPDDARSAKQELAQIARRVSEINSELKDLGVAPPAAEGKRKLEDILSERRAAEERYDEFGNRIRSPQEVAAAREKAAQPYYEEQLKAARNAATQRQVEDIEAGYVPEQVPPSVTPKDKVLEAQLRFQEQYDSAQDAAQKRAAEAEAKRRGFIVDDFGNVVPGKEIAEQSLGNQKVDAIRSKTLQTFTPKELQTQIDTGYVTPAVQKFLGLSLPERKESVPAQGELPTAMGMGAPEFEGYNLNQRDQAETVLPVLQQRLDELASIKNLFIGEPLTAGTKPTAQAKRLFEVEAQIKELNRLKSIAEGAPVKLDQDFGKIRQRLNTLKEQSNTVLEDELFEPVTRLRAGETQEGGAPLSVGERSTLTARTKYLEQAKAATQQLQDTAVEQANLQRTLEGYGPIGRDQEIGLRMRVKQALERVTKSASAPFEKNAEMAQRITALAQRTKDAGAVQLLNKAQGLFAQNNSSNALVKAAENVLKKGVTPGTLTQLQRAINATLVRRISDTEGRVVSAVPNVKTDYAPILKAIDARIQAAKNAGIATEDPRMQSLLREYSNITKKQKQQQTTPERGIAEPEKQALRTALDKAVADASKVKVVKQKGPFALAPQTRQLEEKREAERRGGTETMLAEGKSLQNVRRGIKKLIALGAKRSELGDLTQLLSTKFKVTTVREQKAYQQKLRKLATLEKKLMDSAGAGELAKFRKYVATKIDTALTRPNVPADVRKALETAQERFVQNKGTRTTTVKKVSEALIGARTIEGLDAGWRYDKTTNRIYAPELEGGKVEQVSYDEFVHGTLDSANALADSVLLGRPESPSELNDALAREREAVEQHETQRDLFVEPAREDQARPDLFTAIKRSTPEKFRAFQASLKRRTDRQIEEAVAQNAMTKEVTQLKKTITAIKTRMATLFEDTKVDVQRSRGFSDAVQEQLVKVRETFAESGVLETDEAFTKALDKALKPLEPLLTKLAEKEATLRYRDMSSALLDYQGQVQALQNAVKSNLQLGNFQNRLQREGTNLGVLLDRVTKKRLELEEAERRAQVREQRKAEEEKLAAAQANLRTKGVVRTVTAKDVSVEKLNEVTAERRELQQLRKDKTLPAEELRNIKDQIQQLRNQEYAIRVGLVELAKSGRLETRIEKSTLEGKEGRSNEEIAEERKAFLEEARQSQERALSARLRKLTAELGLLTKQTDAVVEAFAKQRQAGKAALQGVPEAVVKKFKNDMRNLKAKRTRTQTKIANAIEVGLRSGASFEMSQRMSLPDLDRAIASVTEQLKTASPKQEAALNKERQELMSLAAAINDAVVVSKREKTTVQYKERIPAAKRQKGGQTEEQMKKTAEQQQALAKEKARLFNIEMKQLAIDIEKNDPDLRVASNADTGVAPEQASKVAERVRAAVPEGISVTYAATQDALPDDVKAAIDRMGVGRIKGAVMPDGRVFVVGENHQTAQDVEETFAHELVGHYGVDKVLGPQGMDALIKRLFAKGDAYVAEVATGLGVFKDVSSAMAALGYTKPAVDLTRRRIVQAAGAALAKPVMPTKVVEAFNVTDPETAADALYDAWDSADAWVSQLFSVIKQPNVRKEANYILNETLYRIGGEDFYAAWSNQGEDFVTTDLIEKAISEQGVEQLTRNIKRAYDVAANSIFNLVKTQAKPEKTPSLTEDNINALRTTIVREMIAHAAEGRRVAPTFVGKVAEFVKDMIASVRQAFRNMGLSAAAKQDTKQIQAIIRQASRELMNSRPGVYISPNGEVAFSALKNETPWMSQQSKDMLEAVVTGKNAGLFAKIKGNLYGLTGVTQFVDRTAPFISALNRGVQQGLITDLEATQARYNLSAHDKRMNFTRQVVSDGALKLNKKTEDGNTFWMVEGTDGPSLVSVMQALGTSGLPAEQAGRLFTMYLAGLRTKNEGIGVEALNFGNDAAGKPILTEAKLRQFESEIKSQPQIKDAFEKARSLYNTYNAGLIDFAVQTGAIGKEQGDMLKRRKDFIPFYRQIGGEIQLFIGDEKAPITIGNLKDQPYLHELVGGDTTISDIFTSSVQNTHMLTDMALRNLATKNTAHMLYKLGMLKTKTGKDGREYGIRTGLGQAGPTTLRFKDESLDKDGNRVHVDKHVIVDTAGTIFEDIPPELLVKGMEGVKTTFPKALELLGLPAKFLRRAVVLNPLYPVRQIIRDSLSTYGTSGANYIPIAGPLRNIYKAMVGTSEETKLLQKQGLLGGQLLAAEGMEGLSTILRGVAGGKTSMSSMLAWLETKSMQADVGVRVSSYNSFRKQGLNELEAWVAANELMDFNKRGVSPSVYFANSLIPFFNAQIQGLNVFAKAMTGRMPYNDRLAVQEKFFKRGLSLAALTLMYAAAMEDDEAYKNAPPDQRYSNWFIRTPFFDEALRIPIPFEYGLLFKALPEAIFDTAFGKEEFKPMAKAVASMAVNALPGGSSMGIPQFMKPLVEMTTGKDLYTKADIETKKEQALPAGERYRDTTTEASKLLGQTLGVSPLMIDQFVRSVGTQSMLAVVSMADPFLNPNKPQSAESKTSQIPLIGGLFQPTDAGGIINRTYDLMLKAEQTANGYEKMLSEGRTKEAETFLNANMSYMLLSDSVKEFRSSMGEIKEWEDTIRADKMMLPTEKRKQLDMARKLKIDVATVYRDVYRSAAAGKQNTVSAVQ